ncbi:sugar tyrosine-protein kinase [Buttiauxella sp.]|uniref:sugar tyrosine-protein kinase n=1 Tax=Buttiauxella sp. TaxID=1972222 RepID=UPI003C738FFD
MNKKKLTVLILFIIGCLLLTYKLGVSFKSDDSLRTKAENKVSLFQDLYNNLELEKIYDESCDNFQKMTPRDEFLSIMIGKKEVFGRFKHSTLFYTNVINSKKVALRYRTYYEHYSLIEEFTYNDEGGLCLQGFYIDDSGKLGEVIKLD